MAMKMSGAMRISFRARLLAVALLAGAPPPAAALEIHEEFIARLHWPAHANGDNIAALPAVQLALRRFDESGDIRVVIRYPGGDSGRRWAGELRGWLVTLGVPAAYLELQPGSGVAGRLVVSILKR